MHSTRPTHPARGALWSTLLLLSIVAGCDTDLEPDLCPGNFSPLFDVSAPLDEGRAQLSSSCLLDCPTAPSWTVGSSSQLRLDLLPVRDAEDLRLVSQHPEVLEVEQNDPGCRTRGFPFTLHALSPGDAVLEAFEGDMLVDRITWRVRAPDTLVLTDLLNQDAGEVPFCAEVGSLFALGARPRDSDGERIEWDGQEAEWELDGDAAKFVSGASEVPEEAADADAGAVVLLGAFRAGTVVVRVRRGDLEDEVELHVAASGSGACRSQ